MEIALCIEKACTKCKVKKPIDAFNQMGGGRRRPDCRICEIEARRERDDRLNLRRRENPELRREDKRLWRKNNPGKVSMARARRRTRQEKATPSWADVEEIGKFYQLRDLLNIIFEKPHAVDHMVCLISNFVCGLHVQDNLCVITAKANGKKGNRWWPDMPEYTRKDKAELLAIKAQLVASGEWPKIEEEKPNEPITSQSIYLTIGQGAAHSQGYASRPQRLSPYDGDL